MEKIPPTHLMSIVTENGIFLFSTAAPDASNSLSLVSNKSRSDRSSSLHWWRETQEEHSTSQAVNVRRRRSSTSSPMKLASQAKSSSSSSIASSSQSILQSRALPYVSSGGRGDSVLLTSPIDQLNHISGTQYPYSNLLHSDIPDPPARPYVNWNTDAYKPYFDPMPGDTNVTAQLGKSTFLRCRIKQITDEPVSSGVLERAQMRLTMCTKRREKEKKKKDRGRDRESERVRTRKQLNRTMRATQG